MKILLKQLKTDFIGNQGEAREVLCVVLMLIGGQDGMGSSREMVAKLPIDSENDAESNVHYILMLLS